MLAVRTDQSATTEQQIGVFGMIVVSDAAVAVGITAIPGPITDNQDDGWFTYVPIAQSFQHITGAGFESQVATQYLIASKGRRVVQEGEQVAMVLENAHASTGMLVGVVLRLLSQVRGTG